MQQVQLLTGNTLAAGVSSNTFRPGVSGPSDVVLFSEVTNGAGLAPTSAPLGYFVPMIQLGSTWHEYVDPYIQIAALSPAGNAIVRKAIVLRNVPPLPMRLDYVQTSGGGAGASCSLVAMVAP